MDAERWLEHRLDVLKMRTLIDQDFHTIPPKLEQKMLSFDPNERNSKGETLIVAVIKYLTDQGKQIRALNLIIRAGGDANVAENKNGKTPLMFACMKCNDNCGRLLMNLSPTLDLTAQDRMGNTALMYAVLYGYPSMVNLLVDALTKNWSFDVFRQRNVMGHTAESLARKNGREDCAKLLRRERLQMLQRMHRQLALIHLSAKCKGWNQLAQVQTVYKAKEAFKKSVNGQISESAPPIAIKPKATVSRKETHARRCSTGSRQHQDSELHLPPVETPHRPLTSPANVH